LGTRLLRVARAGLQDWSSVRTEQSMEIA
jgi:hypothetical protein